MHMHLQRGRRMSRAVIFDFDGVLVDSEPLYLRAANRVLEECGMQPATLDEQLSCIGNPKGFAGLLEKRGLPSERAHALRSRRREILLDLAKDIPLLPGARDLIESLKELHTPIGLATGTRRIVLDALLETTSLRNAFDTVVAYEDVDEHKPHPAPYLLAAKNLGVHARECVAIEDSTHGIASAKAAGCIVVAVANESTPTQNHANANHVKKGLHEMNAQWLRDL